MRKEIIWLKDPLKYSYLRETVYLTTAPKKIALKTPIWEDQAEIIGYEIFIKENEVAQNTYERRVWWLKNHDRDLDPEGVYKNNCPSEAVLPESICAGEESRSPKIIRATLS